MTGQDRDNMLDANVILDLPDQLWVMLSPESY